MCAIAWALREILMVAERCYMYETKQKKGKGKGGKGKKKQPYLYACAGFSSGSLSMQSDAKDRGNFTRQTDDGQLLTLIGPAHKVFGAVHTDTNDIHPRWRVPEAAYGTLAMTSRKACTGLSEGWVCVTSSECLLLSVCMISV